MGKKRAMITVDAEQWDRVQEMLKEKGYPTGSMSHYIGCCIDDLEAYLEDRPSPFAHSPLFELEVKKKGIVQALRDRGWIVIEDDSKPE